MANVFISFSRKDMRHAERLHAGLVQRGLDVWWMKNIAPGESAIRAVSQELERADQVVLAWSRHAAESPYVEGEIMHAFGARKLLPVRVEKWSWPAFLSSIQYVDMTSDAEEQTAWSQIDERLKLRSPDPNAPLGPGSIATPRSAGPVRTIALQRVWLAWRSRPRGGGA